MAHSIAKEVFYTEGCDDVLCKKYDHEKVLSTLKTAGSGPVILALGTGL